MCFTHVNSPSAIEKDVPNDVISKYIPMFTKDELFLKKFYI